MSANDHQVGGDHYQSPIQHWDFVVANKLDYFQGQITKYVCRWRKKGGLNDLMKARHFLDKYIEVAREEASSQVTQPVLQQDDDPLPEPGGIQLYSPCYKPVGADGRTREIPGVVESMGVALDIKPMPKRTAPRKECSACNGDGYLIPTEDGGSMVCRDCNGSGLEQDPATTERYQ